MLAAAQSTEEVFAKIERAIATTDAQALSNYFGPQVEVTIGEKYEIYSKDQATFVIKEFFQDHPVRSFRIKHTGNSNSTYYGLGDYYSTRGAFLVNVFLKKTGNTYVIEEVRFETMN